TRVSTAKDTHSAFISLDRCRPILPFIPACSGSIAPAIKGNASNHQATVGMNFSVDEREDCGQRRPGGGDRQLDRGECPWRRLCDSNCIQDTGQRGRRQRQSAATAFTAVQPLAADACVKDSKAGLGSRGLCEEIDWMSGLKGREFGADSNKTSVFICCTQS